MSKRKSVHLSGFRHQNPIPNACRIGNLLMSGVIVGRPPSGGAMPKALDEQLTNLFLNVDELMRNAGGSTNDIVKMTFWMRDPSDRTLLNEHWVRCFPDPESRPSRQTLPSQGSGPDTMVTCDVTAYFG